MAIASTAPVTAKPMTQYQVWVQYIQAPTPPISFTSPAPMPPMA